MAKAAITQTEKRHIEVMGELELLKKEHKPAPWYEWFTTLLTIVLIVATSVWAGWLGGINKPAEIVEVGVTQVEIVHVDNIMILEEGRQIDIYVYANSENYTHMRVYFYEGKDKNEVVFKRAELTINGKTSIEYNYDIRYDTTATREEFIDNIYATYNGLTQEQLRSLLD